MNIERIDALIEEISDRISEVLKISDFNGVAEMIKALQSWCPQELSLSNNFIFSQSFSAVQAKKNIFCKFSQNKHK